MEAGEVARRLNDESAQKDENSESIKVARRRKAVLKVGVLWRINLVLFAPFSGFRVFCLSDMGASKLRTTLTQALEHSRLPDRDFLAYLTALQEKFTKELASNLS
jgi:hypothetical protein